MTAALAAAALFGGIAVVQASAIRRYGFFSMPMLGVLIGYLAGWGLHLVAIATLPLYLAQVGIGASLVVTAMVAAVVLDEPLRVEHWLAVLAMTVGLGVLATASGSVGDSVFSTRTTLSLYLLLFAVTAAGWLAFRSRHRSSGVILGVLAGVCYGASPIATRALIHFSPDLDTIGATLSIGLFGGMGFLLYSVALKRTSAMAATAPLILFQTVLPSVVGIWLFGDDVRSGWWPYAVVAFLVSLAAGVTLSGVEMHIELGEDATTDAVES